MLLRDRTNPPETCADGRLNAELSLTLSCPCPALDNRPVEHGPGDHYLRRNALLMALQPRAFTCSAMVA